MRILQRASGIGCLVVMVGLVVFSGRGLAAEAPEPLRNRQEAPDEASTPDPGSPPGTVRQGNTTATGTGGSQDSTVIVTPPVGVVPVIPVPGDPVIPAPEDPVGKSPADVVVPGDKIAPDVVVPGVVDKDATKAARPTDVPGGEGVLPVDRVVPGATVVPTDKTGEKAAPGAAIPPPTGEAGDVTATGTGGNQKTDINIAPPVVGVPPVVTVPGVPVVTPGSEKAVEVPGEPVQVAPGSKVLDEAGRPVDLAPGRMVVLPNGGKIVDEQGKTSVVPPGGRVLLPGRIMTPGDFLPKAEGDAKAAQEGKKKAETPPADSKPTPPAEPTQKKKPGSTEKPEKPAQAPKSEAKPKKGDPFKVPMSACEKQTLDFLAGCWRGEVGLSDKSKVNIQLCFDANGVGRRVDRYTRDGKRCSGASTARWEKGRISFSFDTLYCSNGEAGTDIPVVCEGCGEDTKCIGSIYVKNKGMVAKSNFRIVRE